VLCIEGLIKITLTMGFSEQSKFILDLRWFSSHANGNEALEKRPLIDHLP